MLSWSCSGSNRKSLLTTCKMHRIIPYTGLSIRRYDSTHVASYYKYYRVIISLIWLYPSHPLMAFVMSPKLKIFYIQRAAGALYSIGQDRIRSDLSNYYRLTLRTSCFNTNRKSRCILTKVYKLPSIILLRSLNFLLILYQKMSQSNIKPTMSSHTETTYAVLACDRQFLAASMEHRIKGRLAFLRVREEPKSK